VNSTETVTVVPATNLDLPPVEGAEELGAAVTFSANGVGKPTITGATPTVSADGMSATVAVTVTSGGVGSTTFVGVMSSGSCTGMVQASGGAATVTTSVTPNVSNRIKVCAESRVDTVSYAQADNVDVTVYPWVDPGLPSVTTGYKVDSSCTGDGMSCSTGVTAPVIDLTGLPATIAVLYQFDGGTATANFSNMPIGTPTAVTAKLCVVFGSSSSQCSPTGIAVSPEPGTAPYRTQITVQPCTVGTAPTVAVSAASNDYSVYWTLRDDNGDETYDYTLMRTAQVTVKFKAQLHNIDDWTSAETTCTGVPEPTPDPSVSPTP
jgi:hypothetical protein